MHSFLHFFLNSFLLSFLLSFLQEVRYLDLQYRKCRPDVGPYDWLKYESQCISASATHAAPPPQQSRHWPCRLAQVLTGTLGFLRCVDIVRLS